MDFKLRCIKTKNSPFGVKAYKDKVYIFKNGRTTWENGIESFRYDSAEDFFKHNINLRVHFEEVKEMKELTFKEVIANIKEGEVWESNCKRIRCLKDGNLKIDNIPLRDFGPSVLINSINIYKLQRKEYTFEEAFKAYEEGKEIKSSKGISYKKDYETEYDEAISMDEIRGKWYIND